MIDIRVLGVMDAIKDFETLSRRLPGAGIPDEEGYVVGPQVSYAKFPEFGFGQPAQPFVRPTAYEIMAGKGQKRMTQWIAEGYSSKRALYKLAMYAKKRMMERWRMHRPHPYSTGEMMSSMTIKEVG